MPQTPKQPDTSTTPETMAQAIGRQVQAERFRRGLSRYAAGVVLETPHQTILNVERGTRSVSDDLAAKLETKWGLRLNRACPCCDRPYGTTAPYKPELDTPLSGPDETGPENEGPWLDRGGPHEGSEEEESHPR